MSTALRSAAGRKAALSRWHPDRPHADADDDLLAARVAELVAAAPPLSKAMADRLAAIIQTAVRTAEPAGSATS